jgi:ankyrin repeat protein
MRDKYFFQIILLSLLIAGCSNSGVSDRKGKSHADREHQAAKEINPLMLLSSVINNDLAGVRALLEQEVEVNTLDVDKRSALMYASYEGYVDIMESLISYGADPDLCDVNGRTALMFAASGPLPGAVRLLLEKGATVNIQDIDEHYTALMYAAAEGQLENVRLLIEHGADPMIKDVDGDNAMVFARNNNHREVADFLETQMQ